MCAWGQQIRCIRHHLFNCIANRNFATAWSRVLLEKLTVSQLVENSSNFMDTGGHYPQFAPILSQIKKIHAFPTIFLKINFNIMLTSTPMSVSETVGIRNCQLYVSVIIIIIIIILFFYFYFYFFLLKLLFPAYSAPVVGCAWDGERNVCRP